MPYKYFDDTWRTKIFLCRACGWSGTYDQALTASYETFLDLMCPRCEPLCPPTIALVLYPTVAELRANIDKPGVREQIRLIDSFREAK